MSDIVRKIQMLLRKTPENGSTEAESQSAILMAQKLMLQHKLTEDDIEEREYGSGAFEIRKEAYRKPVTNFMSIQWWQWQLAAVIVENFRCFYWTEGNWRVSKNLKRIIFLGLKEDTEIANDVYQFASKSIVYLAKNYLEDKGIMNGSMKTKLRNDYMTGFIDGLKSKFKKQVESNNFQLALVKDEIVLAEHKDANLKKGRALSISGAGGSDGADAMRAGYEAGQNFNYGAKALK